MIVKGLTLFCATWHALWIIPIGKHHSIPSHS